MLWWEAGLAHIGGQEGRDAAEQVDAPAGADSSCVHAGTDVLAQDSCS